MKLLLDTHTILWWLEGSPYLSSRARASICEKQNLAWFSMASVWELALKISLGKLDLSRSLHQIQSELENSAIRLLPIQYDHCVAIVQLPFHHHDPFDRLLIAQAICEGMHLVSRDEMMDTYGVERVW